MGINIVPLILRGRPLIIWGGGVVRIFANEFFFRRPSEPNYYFYRRIVPWSSADILPLVIFYIPFFFKYFSSIFFCNFCVRSFKLAGKIQEAALGWSRHGTHRPQVRPRCTDHTDDRAPGTIPHSSFKYFSSAISAYVHSS